MASIFNPALLANFSGRAGGENGVPYARPLGTFEKILLAVIALAGYVVARIVLAILGVPGVPGVSSLLLLNHPLYAPLAVMVLLVAFTLIARPAVGRIRYDAPLFCAAIALLAVPTQGGDVRNALLDAGAATVYVRMAVEMILLSLAVVGGYVVLAATAPGRVADEVASDSSAATTGQDTAGDRLAAVGVQALIVLALLSILGQSPLKGQALLSVALAGGLGGWMSYKTRIVRGSVWYVAGTLMAGLIAYVWTYFHPQGLDLGDTRGYLAGAARSLPLHYATAGVAGTIYGYWAGRTGAADMVPSG